MGSTFLVLGGQVNAQGGSTDIISDGQETLLPFGSTWKIPIVTLYRSANFTFEIVREADRLIIRDKTQLILAQTSAGDNVLVTSDNSWSIFQLPITCGSQRCLELETDLPKELSYTFIPNGPLRKEQELSGFFFCFGSGDSVIDFGCQSYSQIFDMNLAGVKPAQADSIIRTRQNEQSRNGAANPVEAAPVMPTEVLSITTNSAYLNYQGGPSLQPPPQTTSSTVTRSASSPTAAASAVSANAGSSESGGGKLSTGAMVGIALGALVLVVVITAIAVFFCLRSRRRRRSRLATAGSGHEQVMLTRSLHGENNSRDLLTEKDNTVHTLIHPNSNDSDFMLHDSNSHDSALRQTLISNGATTYEGSGHDGGAFSRDGGRDTGAFRSEGRDSPAFRDTSHDSTNSRDSEVLYLSLQRHSALPTFDTTPSAPYAGPAASPPRRKPTAAISAAVSALSRNLSSSTSASTQVPTSPGSQYSDYLETEHPTSPKTHISHLQNIGEESGNNREGTARQVEGEPRYGDTRHIPQVFTGTLQAPFLSEPGMSAEEVARLEEEERRIDAAILAADEARQRAGSGLR